MKKLFVMLFCLFALTACVQSTETADEAISYKIDEKATASAPWKVGETILELDHKVINESAERGEGTVLGYRKFLGRTAENYYLVQDFYKDKDVKYSDPYLLIKADALTDNGPNWHTSIHGHLMTYYPNGQKMWERNSKKGVFVDVSRTWNEAGGLSAEMRYGKNGGQRSFVSYHENGQKAMEMQYNEKNQIIKREEWDEQGSPIKRP